MPARKICSCVDIVEQKVSAVTVVIVIFRIDIKPSTSWPAVTRYCLPVQEQGVCSYKCLCLCD